MTRLKTKPRHRSFLCEIKAFMKKKKKDPKETKLEDTKQKIFEIFANDNDLDFDVYLSAISHICFFLIGHVDKTTADIYYDFLSSCSDLVREGTFDVKNYNKFNLKREPKK